VVILILLSCASTQHGGNAQRGTALPTPPQALEASGLSLPYHPKGHLTDLTDVLTATRQAKRVGAAPPPLRVALCCLCFCAKPVHLSAASAPYCRCKNLGSYCRLKGPGVRCKPMWNCGYHPEAIEPQEGARSSISGMDHDCGKAGASRSLGDVQPCSEPSSQLAPLDPRPGWGDRVFGK